MIAPDLQPLAHPIANLKPLPGNPRRGNVEAVMRSYAQFGQRKPVVALRDGTVIAGNHQLQAATMLGWDELAVVFVDDDDTTAKAYALADNRTADLGTYDAPDLAEMLQAVALDPELLLATGYDSDDLAALLDKVELLDPVEITEPDDIPDRAPSITVPGDLWLLGPHRVLCGDSTNPTDVARLMNGRTAALLHADPPYGMGKEAEGVLNDNLYREKLDRFQMEWWAACRPHLDDNASAYIWGNAPDLWRLWYLGGLADTEYFELRNEIVWDKKSTPGMSSDLMTQYPYATERCLFFQFGQQFLSNVNADEFPDAWQPLLDYLSGEANAANLTPADVKAVCGVGMYGHWFTRSQFHVPAAKHYAALQAAYPKHFQRPWQELKAEWDKVKGTGREIINGKQASARSYFDNSHDVMRDVWEFSRVHGDERFGHSTPKPVDMIARALKSSLPEEGIVLEPFGGTGSTLMAAQTTNRIAYTMELDPHYVDVICARYQQATGKQPIHADTKNPHNFLTDPANTTNN